MPVFVTYLPYQTFSLLVAESSYENISRVGFVNNFGLEAADLGEDYLYSDTGKDYRHFPSQMFGASPVQIPKTFRCLLLSQAITP